MGGIQAQRTNTTLAASNKGGAASSFIEMGDTVETVSTLEQGNGRSDSQLVEGRVEVVLALGCWRKYQFLERHRHRLLVRIGTNSQTGMICVTQSKQRSTKIKNCR